MKKFIFLSLFLLAATSAGAETVYLKNGVVASGKIVEKTGASLLLDVGGTKVTYYNDEIDRIEEGDAAPAAAPAAAAPVSEAKRKLILQFIDVFGTRSSMSANFEQMMNSMSPADAAKMRTAFKIDDIIEALIPLYDKYFSEADLQSFINFYGSEDGKKLVSTIPQIMRGSVEISAKYFEEHMPEEFKKQANAAPAAESVAK